MLNCGWIDPAESHTWDQLVATVKPTDPAYLNSLLDTGMRFIRRPYPHDEAHTNPDEEQKAVESFIKAARLSSAKGTYYVGFIMQEPVLYDMAQLILNEKAKRLYTSESSSRRRPPTPYIDKGACPFECCTYGVWTVLKDTPLFDGVNNQKSIGMARKGQRVKATTGVVITDPGIMVIAEEPADRGYRIGETFYTLTYMGEGVFKSWVKGRMAESQLDSICDGPYEYHPCFGEIQKRKSDWWVEIVLPNGMKGWTKEAERFTGADSCG
jgi:hypothetical protein